MTESDRKVNALIVDCGEPDPCRKRIRDYLNKEADRNNHYEYKFIVEAYLKHDTEETIRQKITDMILKLLHLSVSGGAAHELKHPENALFCLMIIGLESNDARVCHQLQKGLRDLSSPTDPYVRHHWYRAMAALQGIYDENENSRVQEQKDDEDFWRQELAKNKDNDIRTLILYALAKANWSVFEDRKIYQALVDSTPPDSGKISLHATLPWRFVREHPGIHRLLETVDRHQPSHEKKEKDLISWISQSMEDEFSKITTEEWLDRMRKKYRWLKLEDRSACPSFHKPGIK
uniref:Uncharacterized protein n=1 Tax=Candidatus Kentrum sp. MB TaxID=2138164 RepID=A0A450XSY4_9GAMM|nr:MAG: hypothetical protein BECKMB1821I_GA0114274_102827 [Candidatus Kentron sp. MB]VFK32400.1 MAG: hypothetical protein BECKMB1821G_GA0114241_11112 [Candidatus Kentron sp. MB]VFK76187.1 MAG: hypothetical protein BECKMB1821H_GA0114242_104519 [Candidatus Kentron sp. MB]